MTAHETLRIGAIGADHIDHEVLTQNRLGKMFLKLFVEEEDLYLALLMDTSKSTDCPKCGKSTRIVKRMKDRQRGVPGGIYISCSACEFFEKL